MELYTLRNANGVEVRLTNYGGIVTSWLVPDRRGSLGDVVLGYDNLEGYLKATPYFGAPGRALRQPHRQGPIHPQRRHPPARCQ